MYINITFHTSTLTKDRENVVSHDISFFKENHNEIEPLIA